MLNKLLLILILGLAGCKDIPKEGPARPAFVCSPRTHTIRVQEWLVGQGHEIEVDGEWGDETEIAFNHEMASEDFK